MNIENSLLTFDSYRTGRAGKSYLYSQDDMNFTGTQLSSNTNGFGDAGVIDLGTNGDMNFTGTRLLSNTKGTGNAGLINLESRGDINFIKDSFLFSVTYGNGNAGDMILSANNLTLKGDSSISSTSFSAPNIQGGEAGDISIQVNDMLHIASLHSEAGGFPSGIFSNSFAQHFNETAGAGGNIDIKATRLSLTDGGQIAVSSSAKRYAKSNNAGNITIDANEIELAGVNLHGGYEMGFANGSGIYASSIGIADNSGNAGNITITAQRMLIKDGAVIESSTNNYADAGHITIDLTEKLEISGYDNSTPQQNIQQSHLNEDVSNQYSESSSGIYSNSIAQTEKAGNGGQITITSPMISLNEKARISTSSYGGNNSGDISLFAKQVVLNNDARISSASKLQNYFEGDIEAYLPNKGDVVEILTSEGQYSGLRYIVAGTSFDPIKIIHQVENENDLKSIKDVKYGDIAFVTSTKQRFMLDGQTNWIQLRQDEGIIKTFNEGSPELAELQSNIFESKEKMPYAAGSLFLVKTAQGSELYAYQIATYNFANNITYQGRLEKINHYSIPVEADSLIQLQDTFNVEVGSIAIDEANTEYHYYSGIEWIKIDKVLRLKSTGDLDFFSHPEQGFSFLNLNGKREAIFTGNNWLMLLSKSIVNTKQELYNLIEPQNGSLVTVKDESSSYFYNNGLWHPQVKGGDAGKIHIAAETVHLFNNAQITTESLSSGGGKINLNITGQLFLSQNAQTTTSVRYGGANGGDLSITSPSVTILDRGNIFARAYKGNGGNIQMTTRGYIVSPHSKVSASSKFGLDGHIHIDAVDSLKNKALTVLPSTFIDADTDFQPICDIKDGSDFRLTPRSGISNMSWDWRSAHED